MLSFECNTANLPERNSGYKGWNYILQTLLQDNTTKMFLSQRLGLFFSNNRGSQSPLKP